MKLTMNGVTVRREDHRLTRAVKLELNSLVLRPRRWDVEGQLEPVIGPGGTELIPLLCRLVRLSRSLGEGRLGSTRS